MSATRVARILARVREIPEGFVRTYGDIDPGAPRLVGRVLAETDEDLPWHRVVRADGSLAKEAASADCFIEECRSAATGWISVGRACRDTSRLTYSYIGI